MQFGKEILSTIGHFTGDEISLFNSKSVLKEFTKNEVLLKEGEVCKSFYFVISGSFFQYRTQDTGEVIIDLHTQNEWMFNQESLIPQQPSQTTIKAFSKSEVVEIGLESFHGLCAASQSFLQFGRLFNQSKNRTFIFDNSLTPTGKYDYIKKEKPDLAKVFPIKMIASFLKIAPETLSRVRANY